MLTGSKWNHADVNIAGSRACVADNATLKELLILISKYFKQFNKDLFARHVPKPELATYRTTSKVWQALITVLPTD